MAGNWKMNLNHLEAIAHVQKLAFALSDKDYDAVEVAVLPPFTDLRSVQTLVDGDKLKIKYGAQDISAHDSGAYTGEISGPMLAKLKCTFVAVGHSERRQYHNETDELCNAKVKAAFKYGITPILCVGEGLDVRKVGEQVPHTLAQVDGGLKDVPAEQAETIVIAYEPVWAIGTGEVATPRTPRRSAGRSAAAWPSCTRRSWPTRSASSTAAPSRAATSRRSWPSPTWTAPWWAVPRWTRTSSSRSSASATSEPALPRPVSMR